MKKISLIGVGSTPSYTFEKSSVTIGRSPCTDIVLRELFVSRNHCVLDWREDKWWIRDNSAAGTSINNVLIGKNQEKVLSHGDMIDLGVPGCNERVSFRFEMVAPVNLDVSLPESQYELEAQSQAITDTNNVKTSLESQRSENLLKIQTMQEELTKRKVEYDTRVKDLEERYAASKASNETKEQNLESALAQEKEALAKEWEDQKKTMLEEIASKKEAEDQLRKEVERLQEILESQKSEWQQRLQEMQESLAVAEAKAEAEKEKFQVEKQREIEQSAALMMEYHKDQMQQLQQDKQRIESDLKAELEKKEAHEKEIQLKLQEAQQKIENVPPAGASVESFENLLEAELQCSICNEPFITAITLNCTHTMCKYCLTEWKKNQRTCPICRAPIVSENRALAMDNFIERMVANLSDEFKKRREQTVAERRTAEAPPPPPPQRGRPRRQTAGRGRGRGRGGRQGNVTEAAARAAIADAMDQIQRATNEAVARSMTIAAMNHRPPAPAGANGGPTAAAAQARPAPPAAHGGPTPAGTHGGPIPPGAARPILLRPMMIVPSARSQLRQVFPGGIRPLAGQIIRLPVNPQVLQIVNRNNPTSPEIVTLDDSSMVTEVVAGEEEVVTLEDEGAAPEDEVVEVEDGSGGEDEGDEEGEEMSGEEDEEDMELFSQNSEPDFDDYMDEFYDDSPPMRTYGYCYVCRDPGHWAPECPFRRRR